MMLTFRLLLNQKRIDDFSQHKVQLLSYHTSKNDHKCVVQNTHKGVSVFEYEPKYFFLLIVSRNFFICLCFNL